MKRITVLMSVLFIALFAFQSTQVSAQMKTREDLIKDRKMAEERVKDKAIKAARREAEELEEVQGWQVPPGERPLAKMLEESWIKQETKKTDLTTGEERDAYIWASGNGVAANKTAAQMQAMEMAKVELAGKLKSEVAALVSANVANAQLSNVDAELIAEVVQSAKTITSATLSNVKPVVLLYRTQIPKKGMKKVSKENRAASQLKPGMTEVQVTLFYDLYQADIQVREQIKQGLKDKVKNNEDDLRKLMGM